MGGGKGSNLAVAVPRDTSAAGGFKGKPGVDIYELILRDHKAASELLDLVEATSPRSVRTREKLFARLKFELHVHLLAEEAVLYTTLRRHALFHRSIRDAADDHGRIERLLRDLDAMPMHGQKWHERFDLLRETVDRHVASEEGGVLEGARQVLSQEEAADLAVWMEVARENFARVAAASAAPGGSGRRRAGGRPQVGGSGGPHRTQP